ncbi:MAG: C-GCAxxG-C-C family protein [bacterium]|nr:C-GCAxxG-C-C family protein [bacterium]
MATTRSDKAVELFKQGYNCSQSVFAAFADLYGMDQETALRVSSSFGGGMGRMREVCGSVSGMFMVAGMETGATEGRDIEGKKHNYDVVQQLAAQFKETNHTIICRELLGLDTKNNTDTRPEARTAEYYKKRPCAELIRQSAEIIENYLRENTDKVL